MPSNSDIAEALLERHGRTYADEADISVDDQPAALYKLLVLSSLLSARISSSIAMDAARGLWDAGWTTADKLAESTWRQRVDVLNDAGYTRYQEQTASQLGDLVELLVERYSGDLRRLREEAGGNRDEIRERLKEFKGVGDTGVDIFFREAQDVWPEVGPAFDDRALDGAAAVGLPKDPDKLADLAEGSRAALSAALVRVGQEDDADAVREAARS